MKHYTLKNQIKLIIADNESAFIQLGQGHVTLPLGNVNEFAGQLLEILGGVIESNEQIAENFTDLDRYENEMEQRGMDRYKGYDNQ